MTSLPARRLLLVHAHPDDETITTGATMARYAAEGAHVTLVTCTLGEEGEILVPELAQLAADRADQLGGYRIGELKRAMAALGVTDYRFLGGAGCYRDSGMIDTPQNNHPRAFWRADPERAAAQLAEVLCEVRPQVVVTYDPDGLYGHPDHIQAHRVTMRAIELAADVWRVRKVYFPSEPRALLAKGIERFAASAENPFAGITDVDALPFVTPDEKLGARIDASAYAGAKEAAMRAHATQVDPGTWLYELAENLGLEPVGVEYYLRAVGEPGSSGLEDDLFAGVDTLPA
jgi:N-acetyl-1-D-myo-inositol-2-amino-2-deoxy-alpha-D-glucopyranoside deacetylase